MKKWIVISHDWETEVAEYDSETEARRDYCEKRKATFVYVTLAQVIETTIPD